MLPAIKKPVLAVQGEDDEYGTMAQVDSIAKRVPHAQVLKLRCTADIHRSAISRSA